MKDREDDGVKCDTLGPVTTTPDRTAAIYGRISQDRTGAGLGVARQIELCRERAELLGLDVVSVHHDNDVSAFSGKPRPGYVALLDDIRSGRVGVVLAWHTDRLHRSPRELEAYIATCDEHGVTTQTVQAGLLDLSTPSGRMTARIIGAVARHESEHRGARVSAARRQRVLAGGYGGGPRPFGFEPDGVTIRASEAAEILKATDALLAGAGLRSAVLDLNRRKVPTSLNAAVWTSRTIKDILLRPRNAGLNVYRGQVAGPAAWPAIVPEPRWRALVALLTDAARRTSPSALGGVRWLGSGLYECGVCGLAELRVSNSSAGVPTYRCRSRHWTPDGTGHVSRKADAVDEYVEAVIVGRLNRPDAVALLQPPPAHIDTDALHAEAIELSQRLDQLADAHADGDVTLSQLTRGSERMRTKLGEVQQGLADAVRGDPLAGLVGPEVDVPAAWRRLDLGRRRTVLDVLMTASILPWTGRRGPDGSRFDPDGVAITWKTP